VNDDSEPATWSSNGPTWTPSSTSLLVNAEATIWPVSASTPRCSLRHARCPLVPCFSVPSIGGHCSHARRSEAALSTIRLLLSPGRRHGRADRGSCAPVISISSPGLGKPSRFVRCNTVRWVITEGWRRCYVLSTRVAAMTARLREPPCWIAAELAAMKLSSGLGALLSRRRPRPQPHATIRTV
jgi:hypothetical protein